MHDEKIIIPWKVNETFDINSYLVSKRAYDKIKKTYFRPVFVFKRDSQFKKIPNMSYFLLLRKQIHLIFESICTPALVLKEFERLEHLLVKEVYLSLHNVEEIVNHKLIHLLENECFRFTQHFLTCPVS